MKGKKLSRREMKEDAFVTFSFRALDFLKKHESKFVIGAVVVAAVFAGSLYFSSSRRKADEMASKQLLAGVLQQRMANYSSAAGSYEDVLSRFSGTPSAKLALLYLGHVRFELGQFEMAADAYERFLRKEKHDRLTRAQAGRGLAACIESAGRFKEAGERYEKVARELDAPEMIPDDLMSAARCQRLAGEPDRAAELLREIVDSYPEFKDLDKAKVYLAELQFSSSQQ